MLLPPSAGYHPLHSLLLAIISCSGCYGGHNKEVAHVYLPVQYKLDLCLLLRMIGFKTIYGGSAGAAGAGGPAPVEVDAVNGAVRADLGVQLAGREPDAHQAAEDPLALRPGLHPSHG